MKRVDLDEEQSFEDHLANGYPSPLQSCDPRRVKRLARAAFLHYLDLYRQSTLNMR